MTDKEKLEKLKKLADAMYYAAQYLTTDASKLHKAMDEYHQFIINEYHKEEPTIPDIVDEHFWEMLGEEPVIKDRFVFKAIPRLLDMIEPNDRAKAYTTKLAEVLEKEGYTTDAKIVRESIKIMNGENVAMATMTEKPVSEDLEEAAIQFATDTETGKVDVLKQSSFFWGAIYHKQQMMKEAVEVPIEEAVPFGSCKWKLCAKLWLDKGVKGNKVKLIIIKEDEQ